MSDIPCQHTIYETVKGSPITVDSIRKGDIFRFAIPLPKLEYSGMELNGIGNFTLPIVINLARDVNIDGN